MQTKKNPFVVVAALYLAVGLLAVAGNLSVEAGLIDSLPRVRWLTVHLVTIGAMTQTLFGVLPALVAHASETPRAPDDGRRWLQWLSLNAGYPLVLVGMASGSTVTAVVGATLVLGALGLLLATVYRVSDWNGATARYYRVAPWYLVVGILAAFGMLLGIHGPGGYFGSIEAHVHANVWGFLALVVAAALSTLLPALLDVDLRYPRLVPVTFWGLTVGAVGLVAGPWLARHELTMLGLGVYVVGTVGLLANVVGTYRASDRGYTRRIALVLGAYLWLVFPVPWAPLVLLFPDTVPGAAIEMAAIDGLVFGWMLQLAMAFLPVVAVATDRATDDGFVAAVADAAETVPRPSWVQIGSVNAGMLALWVRAIPIVEPLDETLVLVGYGLIALAWALFVVALWRGMAGVGSARVDRDDQSVADPATD